MLYNDSFRSDIQFEYFSQNYEQFKLDFAQYSALDSLLPFIEEEILENMAKRQINYFRLSSKQTLDGKDRYFYFKVRQVPVQPTIRIFSYIGNTTKKEALSSKFR